MIRSGTHFPINQPVSDVLARGYDVLFKPMRKECFSEYLGTAMRFYRRAVFEAYVVFWPDKDGRFVWESQQLSSQAEAMDIV
jgi:hypothetical protein